MNKALTLSAAELATLWGPPTAEIADLVEMVAARWLSAPAKAFIDPSDPRNLILGYGQKSDGSWAPVGFSFDLLRYVFWVTAPMGRGKSEWLKSLLAGLLRAWAGFMVLDCKGTDLVNGTIPLIPLSREKDVAILDLGGVRCNGDHLFAAMNLLSGDFGRALGVDYDTQASTMMSFFAALDERFEGAPSIQNFATMGMLALMEGEPNATMQHLIRFYDDEDYRAQVCQNLTNAPVQDFWLSRFPQMSSQDTSALTAFKRRIDLLLTYPAIAALSVAPGCSINLRELMDNGGILLAGISAKDGKIASIAATLLLTQMTMAALSRTNVPESQRPDWPVIIDEAQIVFEKNPGMAPIIFSQLRAMRIGTTVVHQNEAQLASILSVLMGNAQGRLIMGAEMEDASSYGNYYRAMGMTKEDFLNMEKFEHQYMRLYGTDAMLFSARMPSMVKPLDEPPPKREYHNWRTVRPPARSAADRRFDEALAQFKELAVLDGNAAIQKLGQLAMRDQAAYRAYCERTKAHRLAQRKFILEHPGCIMDKEQRIRTLSALWIGVPRIETQALQWALLMQARQAAEARAAKAEAEKAAKGNRGKQNGTKAPKQVAPMEGMIATLTPIMPVSPTMGGALPPASSGLPSLEDLLAERGTRRAADDVAAGFEGLE